MAKNFRKKKERMFNESPNCRRCGVLMWLSKSGDGRATKNITKKEHDTMATIGHKYSRLDKRRYTEPGDKKKYELICFKCNHEENMNEIKKLPIEKVWGRSNRKPNREPDAQGSVARDDDSKMDDDKQTH